MNQILRFLAPLAVVGGSVAFAAYLLATRPEPDTRGAPPAKLSVEGIRLQPQEFQVLIPSQGTVKPRTESTLKPQVSGRVLSISPSFREGGFFEQDDVLVTIDPSDYETAKIVAEANLALKQSELELERAQHEQAIENWKELGDGEAPSPLVLREPQLAESLADVKSAEARLQEAVRNLERTQIRAPYAGRILKKEVDVGQYVSPGNVLAAIFAVDYVEIRLPLRNEYLDFINLPEEYRGEETNNPGSLPKVALHGSYGSRDVSWEGHIIRAEGAYDSRSRELFVVAQVIDPYARHGSQPPLKVGQYVKAEIYGTRLNDVFVIPRSAVKEGREVLIIDEQSRIYRRPIEIVVKAGNQVIVRENLQPGEILCTTPLVFATEGALVDATVDGIKLEVDLPKQARKPDNPAKASLGTDPAGQVSKS